MIPHLNAKRRHKMDPNRSLTGDTRTIRHGLPSIRSIIAVTLLAFTTLFTIAGCDVAQASLNPACKGESCRSPSAPPMAQAVGQSRNSDTRRSRGHSAVIFGVADASPSMHLPELCDDLQRWMVREVERTPLRFDLYVGAIASGNAGNPQRLIPWTRIQAQQRASAYTNWSTREAQAKSERQKLISELTQGCAKAISPTRASPLIPTVRKGIRLVERECKFDIPGGCASAALLIISDLQDGRALTVKRLAELEPFDEDESSASALPSLAIHTCGYGAGKNALDDRTEQYLLNGWRQALGPHLVSNSPICL